MDLASLSQSTPSSISGSSRSTDSAFREADFLQIMLQEVTNQDPFEPQKTAELVENMRKLQELANVNYEKFRGDINWAQDLVGREVTVGQANIPESEAQLLRERGVKVDTGFQNVTGQISSYRVVGETVWVTVNDQDYPIDNIKGVSPNTADDPYTLMGAAGNVVGKQVEYVDRDGETASGTVDAVVWDGGSSVRLDIGGERVPFENLRRIGN